MRGDSAKSIICFALRFVGVQVIDFRGLLSGLVLGVDNTGNSTVDVGMGLFGGVHRPGNSLLAAAATTNESNPVADAWEITLKRESDIPRYQLQVGNISNLMKDSWRSDKALLGIRHLRRHVSYKRKVKNSEVRKS